MRRKLIKQGGGGGLTFYVPKKWTDERKLKPGDELEINEWDSSLLVSVPADSRKAESVLELDMADYTERTIRNILNQAYRKGFDKMQVKYMRREQLKSIAEITHETLLGFEVTEESPNSCIVQNIAEPSADKYDVMLRKIFLLIKQDAEEIQKSLEEGVFDGGKRAETKNLVDKYTNFVRRVIIKHKIAGLQDSYLLFFLVSQLSLIQHAYFYLHKLVIEQKAKKPSQSVLNLLVKSNDLFSKFYDAFYRKDIGLAHSIQVSKDSLLKQVYGLLQKSSGMNNVALYHIGEIIRLIQMASTVIFGLLEKESKF